MIKITNTEMVKSFMPLFEYWRKKYKIKKMPFTRDRRWRAGFVVVVHSSKDMRIRYNPHKLKEWPYEVVVLAIFHEIGHILQNRPRDYGTETQKLICEYRAERFAVNQVKMHYPYMMPLISIWHKRRMRSKKWRKDHSLHFQAYSQIKEYMV